MKLKQNEFISSIKLGSGTIDIQAAEWPGEGASGAQ